MPKPQRSSILGRPIGRRAAMEGVSAAGVVGTVASAVPLRAHADHGSATAPANAPAWSLAPEERSLRAHALVRLEGDALAALRACEGAGVRLLEAYAPRHGGLPFVVEILRDHASVGERRAFELLRADAGGEAPMATVGTLALVMKNRGDGRTPSPEDDARLALRLARALDGRSAALEALPLLSARQRRSGAPFATLHVPLDPARGR